MKWKTGTAVATALLALALTACSTNVYVKSYPIEAATGTYKRIRIAVPTAGVGTAAKVTYGSGSWGSATAKTSVVDGSNILAIVQNEVMRSLQSAGHHSVLVTDSPDLDLRISFEAPSPYCDLKCFLTLTSLPLYQSVGGAQLVDGKTGNIIATYELNTQIRTLRSTPPNQIRHWEIFAKKLAEEVRADLEKLKLAEAEAEAGTVQTASLVR